MSIKKSSLKQALIEAKEIERAAYESAKKALEETLSPRIEQAVKETLMELEKEPVPAVAETAAEQAAHETAETVEEGVKIEVEPGADISVSVNQDGGATITAGATETPAEPETDETPSAEGIPNTDITMDENTMEEEIYEVDGISEEEVPAEAPVAETPAPETPEVPTEAPAQATSENPFEVINQKLDAILSKVETGEEGAGAEGEVEVVDDETVAQPAEAPAQTTAPAEAGGVVAEMGDMEEETIYELDEEDAFVRETDGGMCDEMDTMEEIEIVDEEEIEEAGMSADFSGERSAGRRRQYAPIQGSKGMQAKGHHAPVAPWSQSAMWEGEQKKTQAHNESALDELKQENESLKKTIKEYKESFVVLRKQINEVQVFNAKLAFANKLFTKGGLTNDEKIRIAEEFDKVGTVEEAKKLYNRLVSEVSEVKTPKASPVEKLKTAKPNVPGTQAQPSQSQTLYESDEMKRMKRLAGLLKENTEEA